MFDTELNGYSKRDVNEYLVETLQKLEKFENIIKSQKSEIRSLEKRIEVLNSSNNIIEKAKENADQIINQVLLEANDLDERIHKAILNELDK